MLFSVWISYITFSISTDYWVCAGFGSSSYLTLPKDPAEVVAPELIGCLLVKRQPSGGLLSGVIVETED